ncbi:hypothetical protein MHH52_14245 [Paenibacillus sp. FSL K6-0276]|uniref:hypothetical protein n=1 Tax=Paenibacillus sp. FSL K6-0276 TaxID=2921450 RepID=UPI0030ED2379
MFVPSSHSSGDSGGAGRAVIGRPYLIIAGNRSQIMHSSMSIIFGREYNIVP